VAEFDGHPRHRPTYSAAFIAESDQGAGVLCATNSATFRACAGPRRSTDSLHSGRAYGIRAGLAHLFDPDDEYVNGQPDINRRAKA